MMKNRLLQWTVLACMSITPTGLQAQNQPKEFDPMLDPAARILPSAPAEEWPGAYMWYPGQLAAYYQQQCRDISLARCVNVGYPGKFFQKSRRAYFRKDLKLSQATTLRWAGPSGITLYVDGRQQETPDNRITLPQGQHTLLFKVITANSLPCLLLDGKEVGSPDTWAVSLDESHWTIPESAPMYNKPTVMPDAPQEKTVELRPYRILPLRNSSQPADDRLDIGKHGYALIDFYHLEVGTLTFRAKGKGTVTVRVGETPEEALERDDKKLEQFPLKAISLSEDERLYTVTKRALRYVSLECDHEATISDLRFNASLWPVDFLMQCETDDPRINDLFKMSRATLHTSLHNFYLDGVKRDFLPWSMDAIVSTIGGDYLFGDQQVSKNGISIALMPLHPQKSDMGIPDYPLHALFGLKQNYLRYGDLTTSLQYKDRIIELLDFYASITDENGFLSGSNGTFGGFTPGWATYNGPAKKGIASYAQIMLYDNYRTGAYFARLWHEPALAKRYDRLADALRTNIFKHFWDDKRHAFINGTMNDGKTVDGRLSHHAQYWAILTGLFPTEYYDNLFDNLLPALPRYYDNVSYEKGYEFLAYAKARRVQEMWTFIDRVFGDWMDQGHTRFPENFMPPASRARQLVFYKRPYGLSLCHGANGVPVVVGVLHGLLGFSQSSARPDEYTFQPQLLHLKHIRATVPVKEGLIKLELHAQGESRITLPEGCRVSLITGKGSKPLVLKKAGEHTFTL